VPVLRTSDSGQKALNMMEAYRISHLPIVNNREFLGLISDTDIYDLNMADEPIGNHNLSLFRPFVLFNQHIYEVIEVLSRLKLTVVPVLNEKKEYLGVITQTDLLHQVANLLAMSHKGGIIVLDLDMNDYSLSEISRIVESNDTKILSLYIKPSAVPKRIELTLKTNRVDLSPVIQSFERYNYIIKTSHFHDSEISDLYLNRLEEFMRYLEV
jgi:CBS domain-containing protein